MLIKVTIDRFEGEQAILKTKDKETIIWPKNKLPHNMKEGGGLQIALSADVATESVDKELAKSILNEILETSK